MKTNAPCARTPSVFFVSISILFVMVLNSQPVRAANRTWSGGGADDFWSTPANWDTGAPTAGDGILFGGNVRLSPFNDFPAGTAFNGITFNNPSGPFVLRGNGINPGSGIVDAMPLAPQTINMPLMLGGNSGASVVGDGLLTIAGPISGAGAGFHKDGPGQLSLSASNTFGGPMTIAEGTLSVASDANLGAVPGAPTPGRIAIGSGAVLRTTSGFTLNANRGVNVSSGTIFANAGATLTYGGIIAGGTMLKNGFGGLTLSGANTYGGDTVIQNGTLTLDFTQTVSPMSNIIPGTSALTLGGENAGLGTLSFASLTMNGKASTANSQSFGSTAIERGAAIIRATNGASGSAILNLAALTHTPGGTLNIVTPTATGGAGSINTTTTNTHGILGAWAIVGDGSAPVGSITIGNNWASADGSGPIVPYTGYNDYVSGNLHGAVSAATNLRINTASHPGGAAVAVRVNDENAGTLTDINTIAIQNLVGGDTLAIGTGNTLRLGRYGGIFRQDAVTGGAAAVFYVGGTGGTQTGNGTAGSQNIGTLTAGGADNTPGEIVFTVNAPSQTQGSFIIEPRITDNGSGAVTVVKVGPGSMKIDGNNTYSGGLYILQGRLQFAGSEIGGRNPDGGGTGPIFILPGGQLFPSGATDAATPRITNQLFIAGLGGSAFSSGCIRLSGGNTPPVQELSGEIVLIGDAFISGGAIPGGVPGTNSSISGRIRGPFSFGVGQSGGGEGFDTCFVIRNSANDWSGNTVISSRNSGSRTYLRLGNHEVIPDGLGKGNVIFAPQSGNGVTALDLNGYSETVNGISISTAVPQQAFIENREAGTTSILTVGNNDASSSFAGIIQNGASGSGVVALTKMGRGKLTLTGTNTYTGLTTVNDGTLALSGSGSISSSAQILVNGGTLDVSELSSGFTHSFPVDLDHGTLIVRNTTTPGLTSLNITDSRIRVASLGATPVVVEAGTLATGGATNLIDIGSVGTVASYPAQFTIVKYTSLGGVGFNFGLGNVPTPSTVGYISNNIENTSIDLVLLDGPKPLTWTGGNGSAWDINNTVNWLAFGVTPSVYLDVDSVRFDDTSATGSVNLTTNLQPGAVVVNNSVRTYSYDGLGRMTGPMSLTKEGTGTLILNNSGTNDYFGPTTVSGGTLIFATENAIPSGLSIAAAGTVQVGTNGPAGNLPAGSVVNEGALVFRRTNDLTVANVISGAGTLTKNNGAVLTLSGANTFVGGVTVAEGTLRAGHNAALGTIAGSTTIESGATLDVGANAINLGAEPIIAIGSGAGGNGAIVNNSGSGTFVGPNITKVTMLGDTVFGGTGRLDFRSTPADTGTDATLDAANNFKLIKAGPNQLQLSGVQITGIGDIEVQAGILGLQGAVSPSLGDGLSSLTVFPGATLHFFNVANPLTKALVLKDGAAVQNSSGSNVYAGNILLEGSSRFDVGGSSLTLNGELAGPGGIVKMGTSTLRITWGFNAYLGPTTVSNGTLLVDGGQTDPPGTYTVQGGTLGGVGTIIAPTVINAGGTLSPGTLGSPLGTLRIFNTLSLGGTTAVEVARSGASLENDRVEGITTLTFGGTLRVSSTGDPLLEGDVFDLFDFGSASGTFANLILPSPGPNLMWDTSQLTVNGTITVVAALQPGIASIAQAGTNVVITGTNGVSGGSYYVLTSTNVVLPATNWARLLTNMFDGSGNFNFTNAIDPNTPQRFYLLQVP